MNDTPEIRLTAHQVARLLRFQDYVMSVANFTVSPAGEALASAAPEEALRFLIEQAQAITSGQ